MSREEFHSLPRLQLACVRLSPPTTAGLFEVVYETVLSKTVKKKVDGIADRTHGSRFAKVRPFLSGVEESAAFVSLAAPSTFVMRFRL